MEIGVPYKFENMEHGTVGETPATNEPVQKDTQEVQTTESTSPKQESSYNPKPVLGVQPEKETATEETATQETATEKTTEQLTKQVKTDNSEGEKKDVDVAQETPSKEQDVLAYLNKSNKSTFKTLKEYQDSFKKEVEKKVEVTPEYDEETQRFLNFKKETRRGMSDWMKLNEDHDNKSDVELAFDKIQRDNKGVQLTKKNLNTLLANQLGVDVEDLGDLDESQELQLKLMANTHKNQLKEEQQKFLKPLEATTESAIDEAQRSSDESVEVGGQELPKAEYEKLRKQYLEQRQTAVDGLKESTFDLTITDATGKKVQNYKYEYTDVDKQSMLSKTEDLNSVLNNYVHENGVDHKGLNENFWWADPNNRKKAIEVLLQQARSRGVDEVLKSEKNIDFSNNPKPNNGKEPTGGLGQVDSTFLNGGLKVKFPFNP